MTAAIRPSRIVKDLPLTRLLPNILTLLALCSGLTAIRFALQERWQDAVFAIVVAGLLDMLDGRVARMLNMVSKFGAELDSLSDAVSFGVAPALVLYLWILQKDSDIGWIAVLVFAVCTALRLARFNTMLDDETSPVWAKGYFKGIPAPGGAGLALLPMMLVLEFGATTEWPASVISLWLILIGSLMVSRLPTFAVKGWRIEPKYIAPLLVAIVLLIAALITRPWLTLSGIGVVYFISIPCALLAYRRRQKIEGEKIYVQIG